MPVSPRSARNQQFWCERNLPKGKGEPAWSSRHDDTCNRMTIVNRGRQNGLFVDGLLCQHHRTEQ